MSLVSDLNVPVESRRHPFEVPVMLDHLIDGISEPLVLFNEPLGLAHAIDEVREPAAAPPPDNRANPGLRLEPSLTRANGLIVKALG
jgi:hypothetical protein